MPARLLLETLDHPRQSHTNHHDSNAGHEKRRHFRDSLRACISHQLDDDFGISEDAPDNEQVKKKGNDGDDISIRMDENQDRR